jgi:plastocyanin
MRRTVAIAALALLPLAACGGDDDDASGTPGDNNEEDAGGEQPSGGAAGTVEVVAEDIQLTEDGYTAPAGDVAITYRNEDNVRHTLVIDGVDEAEFKLEVEEQGDSDEGTVALEAGEYEIFCDVPGHSSMRSTLTVE